MSGILTIDGEQFVKVRQIFDARNIYFRAGKKIAVERFAVFQGTHQFDYEVNSRPIDRNGNPIAIATNQDALRNEFFEKTILTRPPVPVVFGKDNNGEFAVKLQPNDLRAQVFESKESGEMIAWSLHVKSISYEGTMSAMGAAKTTGTRIRQSSSSSPSVRQKMYAGATQDMHNAERSGLASNTGDPSHMINIYIQSKSLSIYRNYPNGFGVVDLVGYDPSLWEKLKGVFR
ncbi:hypothetical protein ACFSE1_18080 [Rhizobium helianthi]|uniref:Uncharacterized protein n=1 Tax=Rhizobium helianthi TaxID=1132695 RepID=A0ABW4M821_9HYPH